MDKIPDYRIREEDVKFHIKIDWMDEFSNICLGCWNRQCCGKAVSVNEAVQTWQKANLFSDTYNLEAWSGVEFN